ncbi:SpoIIE family protein phosphatase [Embleya sp. MST-111070]|uniref:SpoIIE family protein phosphatase n=1 Tax=Embleya sp. MST-111070 TaxID=3398231 RepID=UPI003F734FCD
MSVVLLESEDVAWFRDGLAGARGAASRLATRLGLGEYRAGEVALAMSETLSNLIKHAVHGAILLRIVRIGQHGGVACGDGWAAHRDDAGTSMPGPASRDAAADARTLAPGRRAVLVFDRSAAGPASTALGAGRAVLVMLCDGLGHGLLAETAARATIRAFHTGGSRSPKEVVHDIHRALAGTRGAAVAVARNEPEDARVLFCGIGNTAAAIVTPTSKDSLPALPGNAGHRIHNPRTATHPLPTGSALVMHSDGLTERWKPQTLTGVLRHPPTPIAGHLLRSAGKYHDDASVVVAKGPG